VRKYENSVAVYGRYFLSNVSTHKLVLQSVVTKQLTNACALVFSPISSRA
jgi:hypothetical protein